MRAALLIRPGEPLAVEQVSALPPGEHDVVVRVTAAALCHTDIAVRAGEHDYGVPLLMGHEACGVVEWVGAAVTGLQKGDRVVSVTAPACGECIQCRAGHSNICVLSASVRHVLRARREDGSTATGLYGLGAFAEQMTVHRASLVRVQTDLPDEQLALIGCGVTTGLGAALLRCQLREGGTFVVIGCGAVGLAALQGARVAGAAVRIGIDLHPGRLERALALGATHVIDAHSQESVEQVKRLTQELGADACIDAVGTAATFHQAFELVRRAGVVVVVGLPRPGTRYDLDALTFFLSEKRLGSSLFGSVEVSHDIPRFVRLAEEGRIELAPLVSECITLEHINEGLDRLARGEIVRAVVTF